MMVGSAGSVKVTAEEGGSDVSVWGATKACRGCCETSCDDDGKVKGCLIFVLYMYIHQILQQITASKITPTTLPAITPARAPIFTPDPTNKKYYIT